MPKGGGYKVKGQGDVKHKLPTTVVSPIVSGNGKLRTGKVSATTPMPGKKK